MKISKLAYGFIILGILMGGLIITRLFGLWEVSDRENNNRNAMLNGKNIIVNNIEKNNSLYTKN